MSKWIVLTDAASPSKKYHVQASNIEFLTSRIEGPIRCEVHLSTEVLKVAQSLDTILKAVADESVAEIV